MKKLDEQAHEQLLSLGDHLVRGPTDTVVGDAGGGIAGLIILGALGLGGLLAGAAVGATAGVKPKTWLAVGGVAAVAIAGGEIARRGTYQSAPVRNFMLKGGQTAELGGFLALPFGLIAAAASALKGK